MTINISIRRRRRESSDRIVQRAGGGDVGRGKSLGERKEAINDQIKMDTVCFCESLFTQNNVQKKCNLTDKY